MAVRRSPPTNVGTHFICSMMISSDRNFLCFADDSHRPQAQAPKRPQWENNSDSIHRGMNVRGTRSKATTAARSMRLLQMPNIVILGTGMAGFGAAYRLHSEGFT